MADFELDFRHLRCVILVAEYGSFRRAAEFTNIPQSTISRRVCALENRLGFALFDRTRRGAVLTNLGKKFVDEAPRGAEQLRQVVDALRRSRGAAGETLRLGTACFSGASFLTNVLHHFRHEMPGAEIAIDERSSEETIAAVVSGSTDVAFVAGSPDVPGCHTMRLWTESLLVALGSRHPRAARDSISVEELKSETFILNSTGAGSDIHDFLIRRLSEPGFRPRIIRNNAGCASVLSLITAGYGITLVGNAALAMVHPDFTVIPLSNPGETFDFSAVWKVDRSNPALRRLLEICAQISNHTNSVPTTPRR
ncbi:LysR family transcriptional regulator [Martelella soudanensis]|uniref:LysR family transcriptional regulator n=1 Tax=unclassified Martelella TaxID=2629616 RepID=UPI0015DF2972|nr:MULTISPECIES: LysR family transcriptional regulator [unclassified Martelella]